MHDEFRGEKLKLVSKSLEGRQMPDNIVLLSLSLRMWSPAMPRTSVIVYWMEEISRTCWRGCL